MKKICNICLLLLLLTAVGCRQGYEPGDYYKSGGISGIVVDVDADGNAKLLMSLEEVQDIDADSASKWAAQLGDGSWRLPTKDEMGKVRKYRALINKTLEHKKLPAVLSGHTFYWTATPCSKSHTYACGPDGIRCYFSTNASPFYRARGVRSVENVTEK